MPQAGQEDFHMNINISSATAALRSVGHFQERAIAPRAARLRTAILAACQGVWAFLKAVGQARARREMLEVADSISASRPELAARLRKAAREGIAQ
jgi:hypothetical protein